MCSSDLKIDPSAKARRQWKRVKVSLSEEQTAELRNWKIEAKARMQQCSLDERVRISDHSPGHAYWNWPIKATRFRLSLNG